MFASGSIANDELATIATPHALLLEIKLHRFNFGKSHVNALPQAIFNVLFPAGVQGRHQALNCPPLLQAQTLWKENYVRMLAELLYEDALELFATSR
jgi:hypothetical protein